MPMWLGASLCPVDLSWQAAYNLPMAKTCLIAPGTTKLAQLLARRNLKEGWRAVLSVDECEDSESANPICIKWNKRSPFGAAALLRSALSALDSRNFERIFLVFSPPGDNRPFHTLESSELEGILDYQAKGMLYLIREVLGRSMGSLGSGGAEKTELYCLLHSNETELLSPLDRGIMEFYRGLLRGIMSSYENENLNLTVFDATVPETEPFLDFVFEQMGNGKSLTGRWIRYARKSRIFNSKSKRTGSRTR